MGRLFLDRATGATVWDPAPASPAQKAAATRAARKVEAARREARQAEARRIVATGVCPSCGAALRRNLALTGWWMCSQRGADGFRADSTKPACDWQTFTE